MDELERQARSLVAGLAGCAGVVLELGDRKGMEQLIITALRAAHDAGRAEGEREQDIYRAALAVVISDLGGEVTVSARALTEAPELADTEWATTDESFTEGQDVTFQIVVK